MAFERGGSGLGLVRRAWWDGELKEFVHPADGSAAIERSPGTSTAGLRAEPVPIARTEGGQPLQGQLIGRPVIPADGTRPLHLPMLKAHCDGSGACCASYHHMPTTSEDAARIRAVMKDRWEGPVPLDDVFYPAFDEAPEGPLNVVEVDGGCAFLEDDGRCAVHAAGGAEAKPLGCRAFPAVLVACGEEWHASLRSECACMERYATSGAPLHADPQSWANLRAGFVRVWCVPDTVKIDAERSLPRDDYVNWMRGTVASLSKSFDPVEVLMDAESAMGLSPGAGDGAWLASVAETLEAELPELERTHPPGSAYRAAIEWGAETARGLVEDPSAETGWGRGMAQHQGRVGCQLATSVLHGHTLLEQPLLGPALTELRRILWLGLHAAAVRPAREVDGRLESMTAWIFLWRNVLPKEA
ncbi:MAG: YkgJ family cysteine cluster protein [Proteobacteria bacterium]|nr:YkgJ family cysteine cluster protein [Pseudomonadota bacterium]